APCGVGHWRFNSRRLCTSLGSSRWACCILSVAASFRARRVAIDLAAGPAIVAHARSFSRTRAKPAGGDPYIDGGETFRKETAKGAQAVTSWFLVKRNVRSCRGRPFTYQKNPCFVYFFRCSCPLSPRPARPMITGQR